MKSSRLYRFLMVAIALVAFSSCIRVNHNVRSHNYVDSKELGKVVEKTVEVGEFTGIDVSGAVQVILLQSQDSLFYSVTARGNEKCLEQYDIYVENGKLIAEQKKDGTISLVKKDGINLINEDAPLITLTISAPRLDEIELSGACILRQNSTFHQRQTLCVQASGASELRFSDFETDMLVMNLSGASEVDLEKVNCIGGLEIEASGAAEIDGNITSQTFVANVSGAADVDLCINCSSDVDISASGAADIDLRGKCQNLTVDANKYSCDVDTDQLEVTGIKDVPIED